MNRTHNTWHDDVDPENSAHALRNLLAIPDGDHNLND